MSEVKHTPGPWFIGMRGGHNGCAIYDRSGPEPFSDKIIAQVYGLYTNQPVDKQPENEGMANARLIAAAPELLIALQNLLEACTEAEEFKIRRGWQAAQARVAIAKATGEGQS